MKKVFISLTVLSITLTTSQNKNHFSISKNAITELVDNNIVMGASGTVSVNGEYALNMSGGYADEKENIEFTNKTLTRTASIAKPMTAIAVLQLYEKGLIDLEVPIQTYIPEFPVKKKGTITVKHLLNHSSGISAYQSIDEMQSTKDYATLTDAMSVFKDRPLLGKPGVEEFYTTYGYVVLGVLIERVSKLSYEDYMKENIWEKAGMLNTGVEKANETYLNKSKLYHRSNKRRIRLSKRPNNLSNRTSGGGFYSTVEDIVKFGQAIIDYKLITETTTELMLQKHDVIYDGNPYAFGWFLYGQEPNRSGLFGHGGEQTGVSAQLMIVPSRNIVVAIMSNTSGSYDEVIRASVKLIEKAVQYDNDKKSIKTE